MAETDSAGNWTNYIFFGGRRLARNVGGDIKYYITDHLHSTAMFVDKAGTTAAILDDNDMYPWGGVVPGVGKTTSNNTIKFTGQYRDTDTGANLDYFGARYYSNTIGRFMSPDWAAKPTTVPYAKFGDPQSLNLYSYVENGPINRVDTDGHSFAGFDGFMAPRGDGGDLPMADSFFHVSDGSPADPSEVKPQTWKGTVTLLDHKVKVTINAEQKDMKAVQQKLNDAVKVVNDNAAKLTPAEKATIEQIHTIKVTPGETYLGVRGHTLTFSAHHLLREELTVPWLTSLFGHEGKHIDNENTFRGDDAWKDEQSARRFQRQVGSKFGLTKDELNYLDEMSSDSHKQEMQNHISGYKD